MSEAIVQNGLDDVRLVEIYRHAPPVTPVANILSNIFGRTTFSLLPIRIIFDTSAATSTSVSVIMFKIYVFLVITVMSLSSGASVNSNLRHACKLGKIESAETQLRRGADPLAQGGEGKNCIDSAVARGQITILELVKSFFPMMNFDYADASGRTLLHIAALNGHSLVVRFLLDNGCSPNVVDKLGHLPLHYAALKGYSKIVKILKTRTKSTESIGGNLPVHFAAKSGSVKTLMLLLTKKNCYRKNYLGWTPLHFAARNNCVGVIEVLISRGSRVNAVDYSGATPLFLAAYFGKDNAVNVLLSHQANKDIKTNNHKTPLMIAEEHEFHAIKAALERTSDAPLSK